MTPQVGTTEARDGWDSAVYIGGEYTLSHVGIDAGGRFYLYGGAIPAPVSGETRATFASLREVRAAVRAALEAGATRGGALAQAAGAAYYLPGVPA